MSTVPVAAARYRVSALLAGLRVMWAATAPALLFIAANAAVQAGLTYLDLTSGLNLAFLLGVAVSAVSALVLYTVLAAGALGAVDRSAGLRPVLARVRRHGALFIGWASVQWLLVLAAAVVFAPLVLLVAALTPFLPLAAMDGRRNAMGANAAAIGRRFGRWLLTTALLLLGGAVLYLLAAVNTFFVKGTPAAAIFWLVVGLVAWWLLTAWALIYRRDQAGSPG